jgi:hypothetical protein
MQRKLLVLMLALGLSCAWVSMGLAGDVGYRFREQSFSLKRTPGIPSSGVMAADALIGRPLGLATTIAGAAVFAVTLPMSAISGDVDNAAWGLVGCPAGWTFVRPFGRGEPLYEERPVFEP